MITASDSGSTIDLGRYYAILPSADTARHKIYQERFGAKRVPVGYAYDSGSNPHFLTVAELRELIAAHVAGGVPA